MQLSKIINSHTDTGAFKNLSKELLQRPWIAKRNFQKAALETLAKVHHFAQIPHDCVVEIAFSSHYPEKTLAGYGEMGKRSGLVMQHSNILHFGSFEKRV